jgi:hypothetical protein
MKIIQSFLTENPCYKYNVNPALVTTASVRNKYIAFKKNGVKGGMLHSVGCNQSKASVFIKNWNKSTYTRACVHAFIDGNTGDVYQCLPWNFRGLHGGGSSNETHFGVEMCEPDCIKYTGGSSFTCSNLAEAQAVAKRTYESAVELFALRCKEFNLDPLADGVIISHKEGHKRGIASNHGDPEHLWKGLNLPYTMDTFRQAVKAAMNGSKPESTPVTSTKINVNDIVSISDDATYYNGKAVPDWVKKKKWVVKSIEGDRAVIDKSEDGSNSINSPINVKYLSKTAATTVKTEFKSYIVRVTADALNIRKGPGTNYAIVGVIRDKGSYTIVEENGTWGRLKSGAGWISLNYCTKK